MEVGVASERGSGPVLKRSGSCRRSCHTFFRTWGRSTWLRGLQGPQGRSRRSPDRSGSLSPRGSDGLRLRAAGGEDFRGTKLQERIDRRRGATCVVWHGLAKGGTLRSGRSWWNGLIPLAGAQGRREAALRCGEKTFHSFRGRQARARKRRRLRKPEAIRPGGCNLARR